MSHCKVNTITILKCLRDICVSIIISNRKAALCLPNTSTEIVKLPQENKDNIEELT